MFMQLGPLTYRQVEFRNIAPTLRQLIDRAIMQRIKESRL
jgi:hypothetical protein